ncbi:respiratory chain complex I subunit 1 family protein [Shigella flexneri]
MSVLYPLIQALVLFAVAPLLSGITRVARARLHNRRGPGVLQEYRDIFKLLGRQSVGPNASAGFPPDAVCDGGRHADYRYCAAGGDRWFSVAATGDSITLLYLFAIARFFFAISGLDTGSPFTAMARAVKRCLACWSNRCCCLVLGCRTGRRFHQHQQHHRHRLSLAAEPEHPAGTGALCLCFATFIEMGKSPFDLAEAEQELQEGPLSEYSGSGFGVMNGVSA